MILPDRDLEFLRERGLQYETTDEGGYLCLVIPGFKLPTGYTIASADLLIRLPGGYPDLAPDMWWFDPGIFRTDGREITQTQYSEAYIGRTWQRWSRHLDPGQWNSGVDSLESYLSIIVQDLKKHAEAWVPA